ncbi:DNA methyltransferase, partial [bacterium]|nr:DNA methyltransferase [bacterium]
MLTQYIKSISEIEQQGDGTEPSFYGTLSTLILDYAKSSGKINIHVRELPKKTEAGNPDFRIWDGKNKIVGYIEAKAPGTNLDQTETTDQLKRYLKTFPNVILTDFYNFRLYRDGKKLKQVEISFGKISKMGATPPSKNEDEFFELLDMFFSVRELRTYNAQSLAFELAKRTRFLEGIIENLLIEDVKEETELSGFYKAFHEYLISGL